MSWRKVLAFWRRDFLEASSYRLSFILDYAGIAVQLCIFFFIGRLAGNSMLPYLANYGGNYFAYVLIGIAFMSFQTLPLTSLGNALIREQSEGTLEAILMTPTPIGVLMISSFFWNFLAASLQTAAYLAAGIYFFHQHLPPVHWEACLLALFLMMTSLLGFGLWAAGFILVYKKGDPVGFLMQGFSKLLAGVYFPVSLLPFWAQKLSYLLPLTFSLECLRKVLLKGVSLTEIRRELLILALFSVVFIPLGLLFFRWALRRAKRDGSLSFQ